jgi:hypothetical protein
MIRRTLIVVALLLATVPQVMPAQVVAAPSSSASRYTVHYRQPSSKTWAYQGTYDAASARRVADRLRGRGYVVSVQPAQTTTTTTTTPRTTTPSARAVAPLNRSRFPAERAFVTGFPNLGADFEVLAPRNSTFNCIAWSMGITNRWVWPGKSVADFDREYGRLGFYRLRTLDYRLQPGVTRIVLYGQVKPAGMIECTHAARQATDGTWTSKLGKLPLIRHLTPEALNGQSYGRPIAVYVRAVR